MNLFDIIGPVMVIECDQEIPEESIKWFSHLEGVEKVTYYSLASSSQIPNL